MNKCLKAENQHSEKGARVCFEQLLVSPLLVIHSCRLYQSLEACLKETVIYQFDFASYWLTPTLGGQFLRINTANTSPGQSLRGQLKNWFDSLAPNNNYSTIPQVVKGTIASIRSEVEKSKLN